MKAIAFFIQQALSAVGLFSILFAVILLGRTAASGQQTTIPITAVSFPKEVIHIDGGAIDFYAKLSGFDGVIPYGGGEPYFFAQRDSLGFPWQMGFNSNDGLANGGLTGFGSHGHIPYTGYNTGTGYYCNNCWTYAQVLGNGQVDQWHHYRIEWNKDGVAPFNDTTRRMAIYVDGVLNSQQWDPMPLGEDVNEIAGGTLNLISTGNPGKGTLPGLIAIDEFKIYDRDGNLLLWNSLGSEMEVANSIVGPNGSFNGGGNAHFIPGVVGNAVEANPVSGFGNCENGSTVYADADSDGYGNPKKPLLVTDCIVPDGYVRDSTDCDDANPNINPGTSEIPGDGIDNNCNGQLDENNALSFDGANDYVNISDKNFPVGKNSRTITAWVKTRQSGLGEIVSYGSGNKGQCFTIGVWGASIFISSWYTPQYRVRTNNINDGNWHHVAVTYDGINASTYVDGILLDTRVFSINTVANEGKIGARLDAAVEFFNGSIDEVRIWNIARTQAEIQSDMYSHVSGDTTGLVAYYPFNQGIAGGNNTNVITLDDITSKNNDGTLVNFELTGARSNWVEGVPGLDLQDSLALVALYNSTDGNNWTNHQNWLTKNPLSTWYGVIAGGRVIEIALGNNNLTGKIPYAIGHLRKLRRLELNNNQLSGHIPLNFGNLADLEYLYLDSNQLNGSIPKFLGYLTKLVELDLRHNKLRDSIPSNLGNCTNLRILRLAHNQLSGNIPSSFSNLKLLRVLGFGFNNLSGTAPVFLTTLPKLRILGLLLNHFTFDGMEELVLHSFDTLRYYMQRKIPLHQNGNTLSVYAGGTLSHNTYNWYKDGALAATITGDSTFTPTASGAYTVQVTNSIATALTLKSDTINFSALRVATQHNIAGATSNAITDYKLYPNPVRDILHLDNLKGNTTISIITQGGRMVDKKIVSGSSYAWNVKDLAAGSYYVRIEEDKSVSVLKFIKQ